LINNFFLGFNFKYSILNFSDKLYFNGIQNSLVLKLANLDLFHSLILDIHYLDFIINRMV
jgi:hypothetical protein